MDPDAVNDTASTDAGQAVTVDVLGNDTDPDGDTLTISDVGAGTNGTTEIVDGKVVYTPNSGFTGTDTFSYTVADGKGGTDTATATVTVTPPAPTNTDPVAKDDTANTDSGESVRVSVLANDTDADGDTLTVTNAGNGSNGSTTVNDDGTVTYTPNAGFTGTDTFNYTVSDGKGGTDTGSVSVTVEAPAPVNKDPDAVDDAAWFNSGDPIVVNVLANDTDPDGDMLSVTSATNGEFGSVTVNSDGTVTYVPNDPDFVGTDAFTYTVSDGKGGTDTATVSIDVEKEEPDYNYIWGNSKNNTLKGTNKDDYIDGKGGNDCFKVKKDDGDDIINGGKGYDLVSFAHGSAKDYFFVQNGDGTVTVTGPSGCDLLCNIEAVFFEKTQEWLKIDEVIDEYY